MSSLGQLTLFDLLDAPGFSRSAAVVDAVETLASNGEAETRGAIYTRIEVVEFILDLVGYVVSEPLHRRRILEPSFGEGGFLLPIVDRLLHAWREDGGNALSAGEDLREAVRGVELHRETFASTRKAVIDRLVKEGISVSTASELVDQWLVQGDFLLEQQNGCFDFVVGNPPYVRQERIPAPLLAEYRRRYRTMYDRADLYVPFFERSLSLLGNGGTLGFICSDRWMKNRYGGPLREFVSRGYRLRACVDMVETDAFRSGVVAYPAIAVIERTRTAGVTRLVVRPKIERNALSATAAEVRADVLSEGSEVRELLGVVRGSEPWLSERQDRVSIVRRIEDRFPSLEQVGCRVGIGVATGADAAFIGDFDSLDVESDRKLPLVTTRDIQSGEVVWQGRGIINPFASDGALVGLQDYPKLASYLEKRKEIIARRHCAQKAPTNWYRTIDRIWPELTWKPKLLIPDIKGEAHVVFEPGKFYPHHNLYYVVSDVWELRALQAVLLSDVAKLFVAAYSTTMRGGCLRFQAQYLRRIRIPFWQDVSEELRRELSHAATIRKLDACNKAVFKLYELRPKERAVLAIMENNNGD